MFGTGVGAEVAKWNQKKITCTRSVVRSQVKKVALIDALRGGRVSAVDNSSPVTMVQECEKSHGCA